MRIKIDKNKPIPETLNRFGLQIKQVTENGRNITSILGGRQTGKTTELLRLLKKNYLNDQAKGISTILVSHNHGEALRLLSLLVTSLPNIDTLTVYSAKQKTFIPDTIKTSIYIDNVDLFENHLNYSGWKACNITYTEQGISPTLGAQ